jgi:CDP-diacylglycerol--glycerol-3-phosphate 3-phosphatidyltransferase
MFDGSFRTAFDTVVAPVGRGLQRLGVSPDAITAVGILMAAACGVAIGNGWFFWAAVLLALTGLPDALDGAVAKAGGRAGPRGAYLDSVSDRMSDGLLFAGAGWYLSGTDSPRMAMLPFALFIVASLVSYQRAKAESLGFVAKGGLMERAERFIALGVGLLLASLFGAAVLVATLWIMLALTTATAVFRFYRVWGQASGTIPIAEPPQRLRSGRSRRRNRRSVADFRARAQARAEARRRRNSR